MKFRFRCCIDLDDLTSLPDILEVIGDEISNTEMYPPGHIYEEVAWSHYKSSWSIQERKKKKGAANEGGEDVSEV